MSRLISIIALVAITCSNTSAQEHKEVALTTVAKTSGDDTDIEVAKRHHAAAKAFYEASRYTDALEEWQKGKLSKSSPAFDFNIARCHDRLGQWEKAVEHFQKYIDARPDNDEAGIKEATERIQVLRERIKQHALLTRPPPEPPKPPPVVAPPQQKPLYKKWWLWTVVVAGGAVVGGIIAIGVVAGSPRDPQPPTFGSTPFGR